MVKQSFFAFLLSLLLFASFLVIVFPGVNESVAESAGTLRNFYVAIEYDFGGKGYDVFSSQTLVAQQSDQINMTVRNVGNESFQLKIEGQIDVTIKPGVENASGITPVDTEVPVFVASNPGIFGFRCVEHPEMEGQLVILPSDWTSYNPSVQTRSLGQLVLPDFAGEGYDKFFPGLMVVNQGDNVNVSIRNMDSASHGFAMAGYGLNVAINAGQTLPDGSVEQLTTTVAPFVAAKAGVFEYSCTVACGSGHFEMVGSLVVLPTANSLFNPEPVNQYSYLTVKPDFSGEGYDKYLPDTVFVSQNDLVYFKVRNTDTSEHGFSLPNYGINNETVAGAESTNEGLAPTDTYVTPFYASQPGISEFFCTIFCGQGHDQMIGYLVVLPTQNAEATAPVTSASGTISTSLAIELALAMLVVGVLIGLILIGIFGKKGFS